MLWETNCCIIWIRNSFTDWRVSRVLACTGTTRDPKVCGPFFYIGDTLESISRRDHWRSSRNCRR